MAQANGPIIIKRKKVIAGGGHHGGAWKVAYADFVTAMMAFFMLMWLLNATTEQQRKGLADYFAPTVAIARVSGGGAELFGGPSVHSDEGLTEDGSGTPAGVMRAAPFDVDPETGADGPGAVAAEVAALRHLEEALLGRGGESLVSEQALRHVVTRLTDEGLIIEIFALPGAPIFAEATADPLPVTAELVGLVAQAAALVLNPVALSGHLSARPVMLADNPIWELSTRRADAVRRMLGDAGFDMARLRRVTGHGDRSPAVAQPAAMRNDRIEITLLRTARPGGRH